MNYCLQCGSIVKKTFCSPKCVALYRHTHGWDGWGGKGDKNVARRSEVREKIRLKKLGKPRPDMIGKEGWGFKKGHKPWTTGLKKDSNDKLYKASTKQSRTKRLKFVNGETVIYNKRKPLSEWMSEESNLIRKRKIGISITKRNIIFRDLGIFPPKEYVGFTNILKEFIREKYNRRCTDCGIFEIYLSEKLNVHHIDKDKKNFAESNLIPLCRKCHGKTMKFATASIEK